MADSAQPNSLGPPAKVSEVNSGIDTWNSQANAPATATSSSGVRRSGVDSTYRSPARICRLAATSTSVWMSSSRRISCKPSQVAPKLAALSRKHGPTPTVEMTNPATPGPTTLAPLTSTELSAIALPIRSRPTRLFMKACRLGVSTTSTTPATRISAVSDQMSMTCVIVATPSTAATTSWTNAASRSRSRLSYRSATSPPQAPSTSNGAYRPR
jgi:hypothetical protein